MPNVKLGLIPVVFVLLVLFFVILNEKETEQPGKSMMWRIGTVPCHLLATVHLPDPRVTQMSEPLVKALDGADMVVTELDLSPANALKDAHWLYYQDDDCLSGFVPNALLARADAYLKSIRPELGVKGFDKMKLWAFATSLGVLQAQLENPHVSALDSQVFNFPGKTRASLETLAGQAQQYEKLTRDEQVELLQAMLDSVDEMKKTKRDLLSEILDAYVECDVEKLGSLTNSWMVPGNPTHMKLHSVIVLNRNRTLAEGIATIIQANPGKRIVFAVGAAHFAGEKSVIHYLSNLGLKILRE